MILAVYRGSTVTNRRRRIGSVQLPSSAVVYRDSPSCLRVLPWAIRDSLLRLPYRLRQFPPEDHGRRQFRFRGSP